MRHLNRPPPLKRPLRRRTLGLSLVEMMIGITVGLLALVAMASLYLNSIAGSRTASAANQLNQSLRGVMDIMVNDIRRAGHWATPAQGKANPFQEAATNLRVAASCILYSYDATHAGGAPGVVDAGTDFGGFRLNASGVVQAVNPAGLLADTQTACANVTWLDLSDQRTIEITGLSFSLADSRNPPLTSSKCMAFQRATYQGNSAATYQQWTSASTETPACDPAATGAPTPFPDVATHTFVETRIVNITLKGKSRTDATLEEQELREAVLVRSNRIINP